MPLQPLLHPLAQGQERGQQFHRGLRSCHEQLDPGPVLGQHEQLEAGQPSLSWQALFVGPGCLHVFPLFLQVSGDDGQEEQELLLGHVKRREGGEEGGEGRAAVGGCDHNRDITLLS